ncbi:hypothetical protein FOMPIDRAFT_1021582 [Fomitopsis schrenkii]|uniref:Uncharacterized protein n=1 Tax=Fomitopsis schrenkii TaxID=2126942 RepID=S8FW35_FOMSC|nr:hypothetical protein FOMPIDRAFT_1021582 [Fomitopsis schrenkii]
MAIPDTIDPAIYSTRVRLPPVRCIALELWSIIRRPASFHLPTRKVALINLRYVYRLYACKQATGC